MFIKNKFLKNLIMGKGNKRMRIRHTPTIQMKMKTSTRVIIVTGCSLLMLGTGIFLYMNFSNIGDAKAADTVERIMNTSPPKVELEISSAVILPLEQRPATKNEPNIINKRKAILLTQE